MCEGTNQYQPFNQVRHFRSRPNSRPRRHRVANDNRRTGVEVAGQAALLVDPLSVEEIAAGLVRLLTDESLRAELVARGFVQARQFTWERAASQLLGRYRRLLEHDTVL